MASAPSRRPDAVSRGHPRPGRRRAGISWGAGAAALLLGAALPLGASAAVPSPAAPPAPTAEPQDGSRILVGAVVAGREVATFEVIVDGDGFLIPLRPFAELAGIEVQSGVDGSLRLVTPRGRVEVAATDLRRIDERTWIPDAVLEARLATRVRFEASRYALHFEIPWRPGAAPRVTEGIGREPDPERRPPGASLSRMRLHGGWASDGGAGQLTSKLGGLLGGGWWQARLSRSGPGQARLEEYGWSGIDDGRLLLVGHQRLQLHPLLSGMEVTGVQAAWTNQPVEMFARGEPGGELLPRRLRTLTTIRGVGPPAGWALLRIDDRVVARQALGLDGAYEFDDVYVPPGATRRVEVMVFDRYDTSTPAAIHDHGRSVSEYLLPAGAAVVLGGVGEAGNAAMDAMDGRAGEDARAVGFYQARYGLRDDLTVETALQRGAHGTQGVFGVTGRLGRGLIVNGSVGRAAAGFGYQVELERRDDRWRLLARSESRPAGFRYDGAEPLSDHYFEVGYRAAERLELGVIGRSRRDGLRNQEFLLPVLRWRAADNLWLRARPDFDGDYRVDAAWRPVDRLRLALGHDRARTVLDAGYRIGDSLRASLLGEVGPLGHRRGATLSWSAGGRWRPGITVGALLVDGSPGALLAGHVALRPGVLLSLRAETHSRVPGAPVGAGGRVSLTLDADLALAGRRMIPASSVSVVARHGGIAGRLKVADGRSMPAAGLADVPLYLDGRPAGRTDRGGRFQIGNLRPGVYFLELQPDNLPIELNPREAAVTVEVRAGAVTRVDFVADVEFGVAGRVLAGAGPLAGIEVELVDGAGERVGVGTTDRFGLYRIDGVPVGEYSLRLVAPADVGVDDAPTSRVRVEDDFVFGQDLVIDPGAAAAAEPCPGSVNQSTPEAGADCDGTPGIR